VAASVLLVFLVTVFSGTAMRPAVGFVAGLLIALNPAVIAASQYIRFYSLHALIFFIFAAMVFILVAHRRRLSLGTSVALGIIAAVMFLFANHLQVLSQVGLLAVVLGTATILVPDVFKFLRRQAPWISLLLVMAALAVTILGIYAVDVVDKLQTLRSGPGWAQGHEYKYFFYHHMLRNWLPVLWPMMVILAVLSVAQWPRSSIYFLVTFVFIFIVLSIAGVKAERFMAHALPFLFIPMAAGLVTGIQLIIGFLRHRLAQSSGWHRGHPLLTTVPVAITVGVVAIGAIHDPIARGVIRMVTDSGYVKMFGGYGRKADWPAAAEEIREAVKDHPVVVSSSGVKAAYYLGDFSFELNSSVMLETDTGEEFGLDPRTGRQVISSMDSILRIVHGCGPTLVIIEPFHHRKEETFPALDKLGPRLMPAANIWVWRIDPRDIDWSGVDGAVLRAGPLNCRPVALSMAR
jgi:hypothetical protein